MQLRKTSRVFAAAGALALTAALSSCGFDYATDRVYTPAAGTNDRTAMVDVLGATVVSAQEGSGTFIATFANNSTADAASVESITAMTMPGAGEDAAALEVDDFEPIEVPGNGLVNLADEGGIIVSGDVAAGDFIDVVITFGDGTTTEFEVPVMPNCNEWIGLDESAENALTAEEGDQCTVEAPEVEH